MGRKGTKRQETMFLHSPASTCVASGRWLPFLSFSFVTFKWNEHTYTINIWGDKLQCLLRPDRYINDEAGQVGCAVSDRAHGHVQG